MFGAAAMVMVVVVVVVVLISIAYCALIKESLSCRFLFFLGADGFLLPTPWCSCTLFWEVSFPSLPFVFDEVPSVSPPRLGLLSF